VNWLQFGLSILSALIGGFMGGWVVAFRLGPWRAWVDGKLSEHDRRLEKGNPAVDRVPVLQERLDTLIDEFREFRKEIRADFGRIVSREEGDRRHADGG